MFFLNLGGEIQNHWLTWSLDWSIKGEAIYTKTINLPAAGRWDTTKVKQEISWA